LWIGILPALVVLYIRKFVKKPEVRKENRDRLRREKQEFRVPLIEIFRPRLLSNTLTACP
jgi:SHS family lactate transporter-like MFS transporter